MKLKADTQEGPLESLKVLQHELQQCPGRQRLNGWPPRQGDKAQCNIRGHSALSLKESA